MWNDNCDPLFQRPVCHLPSAEHFCVNIQISNHLSLHPSNPLQQQLTAVNPTLFSKGLGHHQSRHYRSGMVPVCYAINQTSYICSGDRIYRAISKFWQYVSVESSPDFVAHRILPTAPTMSCAFGLAVFAVSYIVQYLNRLQTPFSWISPNRFQDSLPMLFF